MSTDEPLTFSGSAIVKIYTIPKSRMSRRPAFPAFYATLDAVDTDCRDAEGRLSLATIHCRRQNYNW